jgi:hypothetical protein
MTTEYECRAVVPRPWSAHAVGAVTPGRAVAVARPVGAAAGWAGYAGCSGKVGAADCVVVACFEGAGFVAAAGTAGTFADATAAGTDGFPDTAGAEATSTRGGAAPSGVARVQAPQAAQKARLGRLAAPQLQHSPTAADVAVTGSDRAGVLGRSWSRPSKDGGVAAAATADGSDVTAADEGRRGGRLDRMGAPASSRRTGADDTSESHSPQNAVTASMGAPHV